MDKVASQPVWCLTAVLVLSMVLAVCGRPGYRDHIPNGHNVPHPCWPDVNWMGVGHQAYGGKGPINPFGRDFMANNKVWTVTLCEMDSDQDGVSNGEELGDPNCVFTEGDPPTITIGITHPGVCEPPLSEKCLRLNGDWMNTTGCVAPEGNAAPSSVYKTHIYAIILVMMARLLFNIRRG